MWKKVRKMIAMILLVLLICFTALTGYTAEQGFHGKGALAFLLYLQSPMKLTEKQYEYTKNEIEVMNEGQKIKGTLYVPKDGKGTRKILIFSHGFNCQSDLLKNKAKSLAASGIATLVFDFRGGSQRGQSEGEMKDMTVDTEISDLNAVVTMVKQNYRWVDHNRIYLMGESFGGMVSALTAVQRQDIAGLILCFPAFSAPESARKTFKTTDDIPDTVNVGGMVTGKKFWASLWNLDVYKEIAAYKGKVLIMHGTNDPRVDPSYSVKADQVYDDSELFLIEGAGHGFGCADGKSSLKTVLCFIKDR
ncbi:MAG: lysophospholipase [Butyrivibrio sp.]|jgi:dienelactone hydrolase|nr:lysophospholipase [Butyrivibrio sp.]